MESGSPSEEGREWLPGKGNRVSVAGGKLEVGKGPIWKGRAKPCFAA